MGKKVLYLVSWYPDEENPNSGVFIKRHAESVSPFYEIIILYVTYKKNIATKKREYQHDKNIHIYCLFLPINLEKYSIVRYIKCRLINKYLYLLIFLLYTCKMYKEIIRAHGYPNLIHVNVMCTEMTNMVFFAFLIRIIYKIPYIITEHDTKYLNIKLNIFQKIILKFTMKYSSCIITVSEILKKGLFKINKSPFKIIPNVVDTNFFFLKNTKSKNEKKVILHVSLLNDEQKNILGILRSVQKLRVERKDFVLKIIGDGSDLNMLMDYAEKIQKPEKWIYFLGNVNNYELVKSYQQSDLFILNSNFETFGCVLIESIACGTPVISTRCGGPEEIINENNGLLIDINNDEELTKSINWALDNLDFFDKKKMREEIINKYSYNVIGQKLSEIYNMCEN